LITLTVISFNGAPPSAALSGRFDELGGTIGRADTNQLVLPDPDRAISRVHAQIAFRNGTYAIIDRGSNPIAVNGQRLSSGSERLISEGDEVQIGGYVLRAQLRAAGPAAVGNDPFADLLGPASTPAAAPAAAWDPLSPRPPAAPVRPSAPAPSAPALPGGIPDDWDPFAPAPAAAAAPAARDPRDLGLDIGAAAPGPLIPGLGSSNSSGADSLDALFGLKPGGGQGDPLGGSLLGEAAAKPNMAGHADPLRALQAAPQATAQSLPDDFSDLHRPFSLPAAPAAAAPVASPIAPPIPAPPPPLVEPPPASAVLSWDAQAEDSTVIRRAARAARPAMPTPAPTPAPPPPPVMAAPAPVAAPPQAPVASAPAMSGATVGAGDPAGVLLAALREGLASPELTLDALTPELMKLLGQIVREAADGTVDLLVARSALKREVHADATMIGARENNPLKFSPSGEVALQHLLTPPLRGFMAAAPAMRDTYNDLRAHQYGLLAGMRAALEGVLQRFDPGEIERRLNQRSMVKSLLPGSRKAALWDAFTEHYAQIRSEAEDDFDSLFGKAFLQAYEQHIVQLRKDKR